MPSADLFETRSDAEIRDLLQRARAHGRTVMREDFVLAVDYLEGRQFDDVESELSDRYERTQTGDRGGQIAPQTIPLTQRYVDEAANAYNRPVVRELVDEQGNLDERRTEELRNFLSDAGFDDVMHRVEQYLVLLKTCGLWFQARAGKLRPLIVWPQDLWPVMADDDWADVADQNDYAGHVVELYRRDDSLLGKSNRYAFVSPSEVGFYSGLTPFNPDAGGITRFANLFRWPQRIDGATPLEGDTKTLPLQMLTYWHSRLPVGELVIDTDPAIAIANRELNLQLSILLDTLAHQGWATMLLNLVNPDSPPSTFSAGPRNGLVIGAGETASMLSSPANYTDLTNVLSTWVRLLAISMRQSPNDFSVQQQQAASGFAKLVDSLPKLEARQERTERLASAEAKIAWPRIAAIGSELGALSGSVEELARLRMVVRFSDIEFPLSVSEQVQKETHEISTGMTTPARLLAARDKISLDEAEARVRENLGLDAEAEPGAGGADDVQKTALNGPQTASMVQITTAVAAREIPREAGVQMMMTSFRIPREEAEALIGEAGRTFTAASVEAKAAPPTAPAAAPAAPAQPQSALGSLIARRRNG